MTSSTTIGWPVKYGLRVASSWPEAPSFITILHKIWWSLVLIVFQTYQYGYVIKHYKYDNLIDTIDNLSICLPFSLVFIKLLVAWTHPGLVRSILSTMDDECRKYSFLDANNLILKTAYLSLRLTSSIICTCVLSTIFYLFGVLGHQETNATYSRQLLMKMDLPFNSQESPVYELTIALQYIYQALSAFTFGVFTAFLLMVVLHVGCQIDIMCQALTVVPHVKDDQLKFFIDRHQEIILFTKRIEQFFTYIALTQLVSNTLITCCLGYLMVIAIQTDNGYALLIKSIIFYIAVCSEVFVYCFAGEYLNIKAKLISDTAYNLLWYDLNPKESRLLILVILRSQRGFRFTFGKFANLSMESFAGIMKASASYISVLLAMT